VIVWRDGGNSNAGTAIVGTVSGSSISFGSPVVFNSAGLNDASATYDSAAGKVVIVYEDNGNSDAGTAIVGTVSGSSISFGSSVAFNSQRTFNLTTTYASDEGKIVVAYSDDNYFYGSAVVGEVSGSSISFGSEVRFDNTNANDLSLTYDPISKKVEH